MLFKLFLFGLIPLLSCSCLEDQKSLYYKINYNPVVVNSEPVIDSTFSGLNFQIKESYRAERSKISKLKLSLRNSYLGLKDSLKKECFIDSVSFIFSDLLLNNVIPNWYGTPWDFEGYTSVPNQGKIACGYFVSTTLNHMGLNLNRYHLARQGPLNEAKSLAIDTNLVLSFSSEEFNIDSEFFSSFPDGLYFVGLDSHVGYLYVYKEQTFFVHSNYIENRVMIEPFDLSEAFESYNYHLVKITGNKNLIRKWLIGELVSIHS